MLIYPCYVPSVHLYGGRPHFFQIKDMVLFFSQLLENILQYLYGFGDSFQDPYIHTCDFLGCLFNIKR
jgi:hypothetical protein